MKLSVLLPTILVACAIYAEAYSTSDRRQAAKLQKRQATNADQMVQNILEWLQTVYAQNSRRVRQGTLREYLPPANTEKPRPFHPGYPPSGVFPEPPFPFPTNPATGGVTAPEGFTPGEENLLPPEQGPKGGENGYVQPEPQPGFTLPTRVPSGEPTTSYPTPQEGEKPSEQPEGFPAGTTTFQPEYPSIQPGYTTAEPGIISSQPTLPSEQPGPFPTHPAGVPEVGPFVTTTLQPGYPTTAQPEQPGQNGFTETTPGVLQTSPDGGLPKEFTSGVQPSQEGTTGYPTPGQPQPSTTLEPEAGVPSLVPTGPGSTEAPSSSFDLQNVNNITPPKPSEQPEPAASEPTASEGPGESGLGSTVLPASTLLPSGFTTSTTSAPSESEKPEGTPEGAESEGSGTTLSPEVNTIPGTGKAEPSGVDEEDLKHPPHIHAIDVQCSKEMMTINIEFNRVFNGVIYSKGFYNNPECRYVQENSGQTKYTFTVNLAMCGTEFVNAFDTQNQSYLENILVLQNEVGIQEVWDTVRSVRCLWEGNIKDTLSVAFSIGMLSQEIVTFSGDTAMAKLDVLLGRGPFGEPANGLVKIGEQMTLVVSVSGDPGFDLQVKDCKAIDSEGKNSIALTDEDGCILKPKLFGAFQKTKETGNTGASIIAYAYFNAFKFPDEMDLMVECNIELCKTDCDMCSKDNQQLEPSRRRRRDVSSNSTLADGVLMGKHLRVILPQDLNEKTALEVVTLDHICMSLQNFVFLTAVLVSLLVVSSFTSLCLWLKRGERKYLKY